MKQPKEAHLQDAHIQSDEDQTSEDMITEAEESSLIGTELNPEALFEQWAKEEAWVEEQASLRQEERFSVGRHPLILVFIIIVSGVLSIYTFPALESVIHEGEFEECGNVLDRGLRQAKGEMIKAFYHQQTCQLSAMVGTTNIFAIGAQENPESKDEFERIRGVSYVVKLNGDQVYAILPAHTKSVEGYRLKNGSLFGLEFTEVGLMIDPQIATSYRHLERELRVNLGLSPQKKLWFFDVSYSPWDHKMPLATSVLTPLICLLSLLALRRELKRRRVVQDEEQTEKEWLDAFEAAALQAGLEPSPGSQSEKEDL